MAVESQAQGEARVYQLTFVPVSITCGAEPPPLLTTETGSPRGLESNSKQTAPESERKLWEELQFPTGEEGEH